MSTTCDLVAERVALGEPLGDAAEHAASCPRCRRLASLPTELGVVHTEADPGIGFTARMTAGAQHRIAVRRRRRIAAGVATAVAATTLGVFLVTREPERAPLAVNPPAPTEPQPATNTKHDPWEDEHDRASVDEDVKALVRFADTDRSRKLSANWTRIGKSLAPYRHVLEGVEP